MKERRSAVTECGGSAAYENATWRAYSWLYAFRGEDRSARLIDFGDDVQVVAVARRTERPLVVNEDAERAIRGVRHWSA